jgi:CAAX protease family protein
MANLLPVTTAPRPPAEASPADGRARFVVPLATTLAVLVAVNVIRAFAPSRADLIVGPVAAAVLLVLAHREGLSWADLGLGRGTRLRGALIALGAFVAVATVYAVAAAVPLTRDAFLDSRYQLGAGDALFTAFVLIPLGTVLVEEVAFRGVLQGLVTRRFGAVWGVGLPAVLFGAWHILPSLGLARANPAVAGFTGGDQILAVLGAVAFTTLAGVLLGELRRRSGSLLASAGLHCAVNGVGVLVAAVIHATGAG